MFDWIKSLFKTTKPTTERPAPPTYYEHRNAVESRKSTPFTQKKNINRYMDRIEIELPRDRETRGTLDVYDQYNGLLFSCRIHGKAITRLSTHAPSGNYNLIKRLKRNNLGEYVFVLKPIKGNALTRKALLLHGGKEFEATDGSLRVSNRDMMRLVNLPSKSLPIRVDIMDINSPLVAETTPITDGFYVDDLLYWYNTIYTQSYLPEVETSDMIYNVSPSYEPPTTETFNTYEPSPPSSSVPTSYSPSSYSSKSFVDDAVRDVPSYEYTSTPSSSTSHSYHHSTTTNYDSGSSSSSSSDSSSSSSSSYDSSSSDSGSSWD